MKKFIQSLFALLLAAVTLTACSSDSAEFIPQQKPVTEGDTGLLCFSEEGLMVITDAEEVRAEIVDVNDFTCKILSDKDGSVVTSFAYGQKPSQIELKVGSYKLVVASQEQIAATAWENPVYGATVPFTIQKAQTTNLDTIKCKLQNIKVTVGYDAELYSILESGSKTDISLGSNTMNFAYTEERAAYFASQADENTLLVDMSLNYAGKNSKMSATITGVKAGQWRKITVNMPHANEGNVTFTITIETLTVDEEIVVDVAELTTLTETIIPDEGVVDPLAPIVTWEGHDLAETFQLKAAHFDADGNCTVPVVFDVDANNSIFKSFVVNIESTSTSFMQSLSDMNILTEFDICQVTSSTNSSLNTALTMVGIPTGTKVLGKASISVPLTNLMGILYEHQGTHTFTLTVTNEAGHTVTQPIVMLVNKASEGGSTGAPVVTWVGYDISKAYTITADLTVKIEVSAPAGIKAFTVDIDSDVLDEQALDGLLPTKGINLINPEDWYADFLGGLFPTGDQVLNQTFLSFDITEFMGMLDLLVAAEDKGYANFVLHVTDNNDVTTDATLQLLIHQ